MIVPIDEAFSMTMAALRRGAVVVLPTDTVYGLAAVAANETAMAHLYEVKGRSSEQSIAVLVADLGQARRLTTDPLDRYARFWPGPLTVVVERDPAAPLFIGADVTSVGIRCPDDVFVRRLAAEVGPIAATSANRPGEPTPATAADIAAQFTVGLVVDGGPRAGAPSTVVDARVDPPRVLRRGALAPSALGIDE